MSKSDIFLCARGSMLDRLRTATRPAHERLERALALIEPLAPKARFAHVLSRLHGFHLAWEPAADALLDCPGFLDTRRRTALLEADLAALGGRQGIDAPGLAFLTNADRAWGSMYVMEGSTLGGQVIAKALRGADWAPPEGLTYFNPYGKRTAEMWGRFRCALMGRMGVCEDEIVIGAVSTFAALHDWVLPFPETDE